MPSARSVADEETKAALPHVGIEHYTGPLAGELAYTCAFVNGIGGNGMALVRHP